MKTTKNPKKISTEEVKHIAKLANLPLTPEELTTFQDQLSDTVAFIDQLSEIDTKDIPITSQVTGKVNELRKDEITPSLSQEEALKNAPKTYNGLFVSKIIWD